LVIGAGKSETVRRVRRRRRRRRRGRIVAPRPDATLDNKKIIP
jgi:hypothetical protein